MIIIIIDTIISIIDGLDIDWRGGGGWCFVGNRRRKWNRRVWETGQVGG